MGIHLPGQCHDLLFVDGIFKQGQIMAVSALGWILAVVEVLVQTDYAQVPVVAPLGEQVCNSRVFCRSGHQVVQNENIIVRW